MKLVFKMVKLVLKTLKLLSIAFCLQGFRTKKASQCNRLMSSAQPLITTYLNGKWRLISFCCQVIRLYRWDDFGWGRQSTRNRFSSSRQWKCAWNWPSNICLHPHVQINFEYRHQVIWTVDSLCYPELRISSAIH